MEKNRYLIIISILFTISVIIWMVYRAPEEVIEPITTTTIVTTTISPTTIFDTTSIMTTTTTIDGEEGESEGEGEGEGETTIPPTSEITRSNTHIRDKVTTFDFVPLGVTLVQYPDGSLHLPDSPTWWYANNWAPFGMGVTKDGKHSIIYHNNLQVRSGDEGSGATLRLSVNGSGWLMQFSDGPVYYDETGSKFDTGFPTVYHQKGKFFSYLAYDENNRIWYYKLNHPDGYINATAEARSVPFWMGKAGGPYVVQGLYYSHEDLDLWGGYVDIANVTTESNFGGVKRTYYGDMAMDREYHRSYKTFESGAKGDFSAMSLHTDEIDMTILQAVNPIDGSDHSTIGDETVPFEHQGRINFFTRGKDFTFNEFEYNDDGNIPLERFYVEGDFDGGYVSLSAQSFQNFGWINPGEGTWWDTEAKTYWGRCFVLWNGEITLDGETIKIKDAFGFGEFTRVEKPKSNSYIMDMPVFPEDEVPKVFQGEEEVAKELMPWMYGIGYDEHGKVIRFHIGVTNTNTMYNFVIDGKPYGGNFDKSDYTYSDGVLTADDGSRMMTVDYHTPHKVTVHFNSTSSISFVATYRGPPLWYGKTTDPDDMLPTPDPDIMLGGYDAPIEIVGKIVHDEQVTNFDAYGIWERVWWTGGWWDDNPPRYWMCFNSEDYYAVVAEVKSHDDDLLFHVGRVAEVEGPAYVFDDFQWLDDGEDVPLDVELNGSIRDAQGNIKGTFDLKTNPEKAKVITSIWAIYGDVSGNVLDDAFTDGTAWVEMHRPIEESISLSLIFRKIIDFLKP